MVRYRIETPVGTVQHGFMKTRLKALRAPRQKAKRRFFRRRPSRGLSNSGTNLRFALAYGFLTDWPDAGDILQQVVGDGVPLLEIVRTVVREPDFAVRILPDKCFEGQVDGNGRRGDHQWRASFRVAKDKEFCRVHLQTCFGGIAAVVDPREDRDSL